MPTLHKAVMPYEAMLSDIRKTLLDCIGTDPSARATLAERLRLTPSELELTLQVEGWDFEFCVRVAHAIDLTVSVMIAEAD